MIAIQANTFIGKYINIRHRFETNVFRKAAKESNHHRDGDGSRPIVWRECRCLESKVGPVISLATRDPGGIATLWRPCQPGRHRSSRSDLGSWSIGLSILHCLHQRFAPRITEESVHRERRAAAARLWAAGRNPSQAVRVGALARRRPAAGDRLQGPFALAAGPVGVQAVRRFPRARAEHPAHR